MGRDWSWLSGGGGKKKSSSKSKKDIKTTPSPSSPAGGDTVTTAGCMSAVFNIFDLQHLQFPINHNLHHLHKGVDAPRNSLEEEEETPFSPSESYSPSVKTPTLVARLMGLDLVPDNYYKSSSSPTLSSSSSETPRISLGRRSVDVNCYEHQRSSLHLKDNNNVKLMRVKEMKKIDEDKENRSPREYAKQIVMQLKENVNRRRRRMGTDITNKEEQSREIHHDSKKKASKITIITNDSSLPSPKTKLTSSPLASKILEKKIQDKTRLQTVQGEKDQKQRKSVKKGKKPENFKPNLVKPPQTKQQELFVRSSAATSNKKKNNNNGVLLIQEHKKTPLSISDFTNFTSVPSLHTIKKKDSSSLHKLSNLHVDRETHSPRNRSSSSSVIPRFLSQLQTHIAQISGGEKEYITRILRRTGIDRDTPISYAKWFSPSHPLDPSIFYFLEHFAITSNSPEELALRCNRKLLFHLIDEILADILKPHINLKPWVCRYPIRSRRNLKGSELINELIRRTEEFPSAKCLVLEDIDALVAGDFPETESAYEEEGEGIVTEIERGIFEILVNETTTDCYATWIKTTTLKSKDDVSVTWGAHVMRYSSNLGSHHDLSSLF